MIYSTNVLTVSISMSLPYFKAGMFGLTNIIPEFFSFNGKVFTTAPPPFLTFFIFAITSCAFEAVIIYFLRKYHCSLQH